MHFPHGAPISPFPFNCLTFKEAIDIFLRNSQKPGVLLLFCFLVGWLVGVFEIWIQGLPTEHSLGNQAWDAFGWRMKEKQAPAVEPQCSLTRGRHGSASILILGYTE